jgi:hypothetical protein
LLLENPDKFEVIALTANGNIEQLTEQAKILNEYSNTYGIKKYMIYHPIPTLSHYLKTPFKPTSHAFSFFIFYRSMPFYSSPFWSASLGKRKADRYFGNLWQR